MAEHPLSILAFNGDDDKPLSSGTLKVVNNQVDQNTGTVTLKAEFPNQDAALWPSEFTTPTLYSSPSRTGSLFRRGACRWALRDCLYTSSKMIRRSKRNRSR